MYAAFLQCGRTLLFEARSLAPSRGEVVPCMSHGYCVVEGTAGARAGTSLRSGARRSRPRAHEDLVNWLRGRSSTSLAVLRRHRFSLRMVVTAEREGLVSVDLDDGTVIVHRAALDRCDREGLPARPATRDERNNSR